MSLQRAHDIDFIIQRFAYLRNIIEMSVAQNFTTLNVISENFFRDLLNILISAELKNLNVSLGNAAAIDLGDKTKKLCVQVTSTPDKPKIVKTITKFVEHGLHKEYQRLVVLISTSKKSYQDDKLSDPTGSFEMDLKKDVWDWDELVKFANDLDHDSLSKVREFVDKAISVAPTQTPLNEVATFIDLMGILSNETHEGAGKGTLNEPDPSGKIRGRFSAHANYLLEQYALHFIEYGAVLAETMKSGDLGAARMRRLGLHLSTKSIALLAECGDDPEEALNKLVEFYISSLQKHGKNSDEGAVRFFMLDQMIKCHVFPNTVQLSA